MMETHNILCLSLLKGVGKVTLRKIINISYKFNFNGKTAKDYSDLINSLKNEYAFLKKFDFTLENYRTAIDKVEEIYSSSDKLNINIISLLDQEYPSKLRGLINSKGVDDSPILIHYKGNIERHNSNRHHVAIIGTREPTNEGILAGKYFSKKFSEEHFSIVSGLAKGCDTLAHKGALENAGHTTAVLAHGLDTVYPKENSKLLEEIINSGGLAISEYPIGTPSLPNYFVERDRIQSGLSDATIVIQTGLKGGTMHAVNTTLNNKKPLYAIDYKSSTNHDKFLGNEHLIESNKAIPLSSANVESEILKLKQSNPRIDIQQTLF